MKMLLQIKMSQIKSTKRLTKDVINNLVFLMNQKNFLQENFKIV